MTVTLIGCGCGTLTCEARAAIESAGMLIGSARLLREYGADKPQTEAVTVAAIKAAIEGAACEKICVLYSGDSGFYSGARLLLPELDERDVRLLPGISSAQAFAVRLKRPWQDWLLCSAHGVDCDAVAAVCQGRPAFFLTGGKTGPAEICRELRDAGLGFLKVYTGEDLGTENERITEGTAEAFSARDFSPLSVLLAEPAPRYPRRVPGIPDTAFLRAEKVPMTKQEVRAEILAELAVTPEDVCWDIGTGTGSAAIELALSCRAVYSVERENAALNIAAQNRERFGAWNLRFVKGEAPGALSELPKPDAVFVGGSGGKLDEILNAIHAANPAARICVSAITLEGLHNSYTALRKLGYETEVTQLSVSRSKPAGGLTLMLAQNPVWLITGYGS
ncbi:MAG: precorrin-6y C5,15-methyltransferase (decarboxylating) subunit CbiE [Oscillospiraceae bacterium]|nr:precorrin-6y C5,15-methyltransferase (decarboxylating) subunit CbiE [Oscillospiraceae bacterium]